MKRIISRRSLLAAATLFALSNVTWAAQNGPYIGIGPGYGILNTPSAKLFVPEGPDTSNTRNQGGWAGRAFVGFIFTSNIGFEAGYTAYSASFYKATEGDLSSSMNYTARDIDGVFKANLSYSIFNLYALGGVAYVMQSTHYSDGGIEYNPDYEVPPDNNTNTHKFRPRYGLGVRIDCKNHFSVGAEAAQVLGLGNFHTNNRAIATQNFYTLYVQYDFDVYRTTF